MGISASGGGGRATRALRLLLLLVLALAAVEYLFGSILDASPLRTYLYTPIYNATQPTVRISGKTAVSWPKLPATLTQNPETKDSHAKNTTLNINSINRFNTTKNNTESVERVSEFETRLNTSTNMTVLEKENVFNTTPLFIVKSESEKMVTTEGVLMKETPPLPLCDKMPNDLGPITANKTDLELEDVEKKFPEVSSGGMYTPPNCTARHRVAIIVPYRDRQQHLAVFLNHMHPFLMKQQLEYGIFIVEQEGTKSFNRAKLMNVGFEESLKSNRWQCFIFHDIDLLPLDTRNLYSCPRQPRHMSASIDKLGFMLPYNDLFGGVSAMTLKQFRRVNGFSNKYWGWGGEDDDMFYRLKKKNYHVARYKMSIARYAMLDHKKSVPNPKRYQLLSQTSKTYQKDGLSTLDYQLVRSVQHRLYTHILANIDERS